MTGDGKQDAVIDFHEGLNVIAGASDTGKSFAFECINFILGSSEVPSCPPEAKGYQTVFIEIKDSCQQEVFTLKRDFSKDNYKSIFICYSAYKDIRQGTFEKLSVSHKAKKSLSKKLLDMCDCPYETVIAKKAKGTTQSFTFRSFIPMIMMGELRVTEKHSAIYRINPKGSNSSTAELTSFQTVISGRDYEKKEKEVSPEIIKAKLRGQIEELSYMIDELRTENAGLEVQDKIRDGQDIVEKIKEINEFIDCKKEEVKKYETEYEQLQSKSGEIRRKIFRLNDNIDKFHLLKKNYLSDLERLEFIFDAHDLTQQLIDVECPICHSPMRVEDAESSNDYFIALSSERTKIQIQISELDDTILDLQNEVKEKERSLEDITLKSELISQELNAILLPIISEKVAEVQALLDIQEQVNIVLRNSEKVKKYNDRISELTNKIDNTKADKGNEIEPVAESYLTGLCNEISALLKECNFIGKEEKVEFNNRTHDLEIDGKPKASYGKGARAIINSVFLLGIMNYCLERDLCHPGVVVLDSPLTTYKEKDKKNGENDESVGRGIKEKFYKMLADEGTSKQIIIFDNEEPDEEVKGKINYLHFSGEAKIGRKGFIPE
ncbi:AAA family ATPase [Anaerostipes butyraticus]|uniref:AAA family ATPase n=1 Tax=Anaerostipes butyraticus TaxID=645466 RepID=UPI001915D499|nr:AAA family ATPase [Anaerostipes butyraticus]